MKERPLISAAILTKNSEKFIDQCLASIRDAVDEIVLADSGSTDRTLEIAKKYGPKLYEYTWQDDFAHARNFVISKATGEWVFVIDSDEVLETEDKEILRRTVRNAKGDAFVVSLKDLKQQTVIAMPRLVRNNGHIRYRRRLHENWYDDRSEHGDVLAERADISLLHFGYAIPEEDFQKKRERNARIFGRELEENPNDPENLYFVGTGQNELGNFNEAAEYLRKAFKLSAGRPVNQAFILNELIHSLGPLQRYEEIVDLIFSNHQLVSLNPELLYYFGLAKASLRDTASAIRAFKECAETDVTKVKAGMAPLDLPLKALEALSMLYLSTGDRVSAGSTARELLQKDPGNKAAEHVLSLLSEGKT